MSVVGEWLAGEFHHWALVGVTVVLAIITGLRYRQTCSADVVVSMEESPNRAFWEVVVFNAGSAAATDVRLYWPESPWDRELWSNAPLPRHQPLQHVPVLRPGGEVRTTLLTRSAAVSEKRWCVGVRWRERRRHWFGRRIGRRFEEHREYVVGPAFGSRAKTTPFEVKVVDGD